MSESRSTGSFSLKKPELTDADKALLEAKPNWERMGEGAKRLLAAQPRQAPRQIRKAASKAKR